MKIFDGFDVVKFPEENLLFVTHNGYLYYIYDCESKYWRKHRNAGNDHITVDMYQDVGKEEVIDAMQGIFPQRETDFMRLCNPEQLCISDMLCLLEADYSEYMSDPLIYNAVHRFLLESDVCHKSFLKVKELLDNATSLQQDNKQVLTQIKELCLIIIGRDILKKEIGIVDGHDCSSYFWIMPVRVIDYSDTNVIDNVAEMRSTEISIEEDDVNQYLKHFLFKHYDDELEANKSRIESWIDCYENEESRSVSGFEWNLTHNFYTFDSVTDILRDISDTIDALFSGKENEFTSKLKEDDTEVELIIDFYRRFIYRLKYMMKVGKENGYDLISFMGP